MDRYVFPAVFEAADEGGFTVTFPDLPGCISEGDSESEALEMAEDALCLHLYGMEVDGDPIPLAGSAGDIRPENGFVSLVTAWMPLVRDREANRPIRKTLTIPKWLNDAGEAAGINFSQTLSERLRELFVGRKSEGRKDESPKIS